MTYPLYCAEITSPLGPITLYIDQGALCAVEFEDRKDRLEELSRKGYGPVCLSKHPDPKRFQDAFARYFAGETGALDDLPVVFKGTEFECAVWAALRRIPAGQTRSYGQLAEELGKPGAARAVGRANQLNPNGIVVPCHRVIGANGQLTGYAGGLERKAWLLRHEGVLAV